MAQPNFTTGQLGLTPGKLALIGVLGLVLTAVLLAPREPAAPPEASSRPRRPIPTRAPRPGSATTRRRPAADAAAAAFPERPRRSWPEMTRQEIEQFNPFFAPADLLAQPKEPDSHADQATDEEQESANQASQLARRQFLDSLQKQGVSLIVESGGEKIAYIGSLVLHVGDEVQGLRVTDIRPDGVILEEAGGPPR